VPGDLRPAVPQCLLPGHRRRVVAGLVLPLVFGRVAQLSVQFHQHAVVPVLAVAAATAAVRAGERRLPGRLGQPVGPFHVAVIAVLQHRMVPAGRRRDELTQVSAPAQPAARPHRRPQPARVGQVPRERAGHPAAHVIKARGRLRQVEQGLLYCGPRRIAARLHCLVRPPGPVQADAGGGQHPALGGNRQVNQLRRPVGEPLQLGRCLVTEHRARPRAEQRRPQLRPTARRSGEGQVDPALRRLPPAAPHPEFDHVRGEAGPEGLCAGDGTRLTPGKVAQRRGKLTVHAGQCAPAHRQNRPAPT
jgi:hypothetical protein